MSVMGVHAGWGVQNIDASKQALGSSQLNKERGLHRVAAGGVELEARPGNSSTPREGGRPWAPSLQAGEARGVVEALRLAKGVNM